MVVYPVKAITPKVNELIKKVLAIDEVVYTEKIVLRLIPVNVEYIKNIAKTGVDYISVGAITKNIKSIDLSMLIDS